MSQIGTEISNIDSSDLGPNSCNEQRNLISDSKKISLRKKSKTADYRNE